MRKQNHPFVYFFAWLIIGIFLGLSILLFRDEISVTFNQHNKAVDHDTDTPARTDNCTQNEHHGFAEAVMKATPAVVSLQTIIWSEAGTEGSNDNKITQQFLGKNSPHRPKRNAETGAGSGVIINENGYILTNYHVISKRDEIRVRLSDGKVAKAELIGSDPDTDLAVLKIELKNLPT